MAAIYHAAATAVAMNQQPIPLKPKLKESQIKTVKLRRTIGNHDKREMIVTLINRKDAELICNALHEFDEACLPHKLSLHTQQLRTDKFSEMCYGTFKEDWNRIRALHPQTMAGFNAAIAAFVVEKIKASSLADERSYLSKAKKPYYMTVEECETRLKAINRLMAKFPGANDVHPLDEQEMKNFFYSLMPAKWQFAMIDSNYRLTDPNHSLRQLVEFMETREVADNAVQALHSQQRNQGRQGTRRPQGGNQGGRPPTYHRGNDGGRRGRGPGFHRGGHGGRFGGRGYHGGNNHQGSHGGRGWQGGRGNSGRGAGYGGRGSSGGRFGGRGGSNNGRGYGQGRGYGYNQQQQGYQSGPQQHDGHHYNDGNDGYQQDDGGYDNNNNNSNNNGGYQDNQDGYHYNNNDQQEFQDDGYQYQQQDGGYDNYFEDDGNNQEQFEEDQVDSHWMDNIGWQA